MNLESIKAQAMLAHQAGRFAEARGLYQKILSAQPDRPDVLHPLGLVEAQLGNRDAGIALIRRAIALEPLVAEHRAVLGFTLLDAGKPEESWLAFRKAIKLQPALSADPPMADGFLALGNQFTREFKFEMAVDCFRCAIAVRLDFAEAFNSLGLTLRQMDRIDEAIAAHRRCIELRPDFPGSYQSLGSALAGRERWDEALAAFQTGVKLRPNDSELLRSVGSTLAAMGRASETIGWYDRALAADPSNFIAASDRIFAIHRLMDYDAAAIFRATREWNDRFAVPHKSKIRPHDNNRDPERTSANSVEPRLRIGYVSPDFLRHSVGWNLLPLLEHRDRANFEVFCYASVSSPDEVTAALRAHVDHWRDIRAVNDDEAAQMIRDDRIDILVDLSGHSGDHRLLVFVRKPAPVQVTYLGYCTTTGLDAMDYRLSDPHLDPPGSDLSVYNERTILLPRTYWCLPMPDAAPVTVKSDQGITFGCLNHAGKISPLLLDLWAKILNAVADSRLILHMPPGSASDLAKDRLAKAGIASDRLELLPRQTPEKYFQTYARIDVTLDPIPWGGGITTRDSLWMGVPVVSLNGATAVGRGGASILHKVGLPELVANSPDEYVAIAAKLALDAPKLAELRRTLRERLRNSPLMDVAGFTRDFEATLRRIWREKSS